MAQLIVDGNEKVEFDNRIAYYSPGTILRNHTQVVHRVAPLTNIRGDDIVTGVSFLEGKERERAMRAGGLNPRDYLRLTAGHTSKVVQVRLSSVRYETDGSIQIAGHSYPAPEPLALYRQGWFEAAILGDTQVGRTIFPMARCVSQNWVCGTAFYELDVRFLLDLKIVPEPPSPVYGQPPESLKFMDDEALILSFLHSVDPHIVNFYNLVTNPENQQWQADLLYDNGEHGFIEGDGLFVVHLQGGAIYDLVNKAEAARVAELQPDYELDLLLEPRDV